MIAKDKNHSGNTFLTNLRLLEQLEPTSQFFLRPLQIFRNYDKTSLRPDFIAGLTVAVVLLPQAIVYAMVAELPPQTGLYAAIVAGITGALWGSSRHLHTGPTNTTSLLVLSVLLPLYQPGTPEFITAAGLLAVMVGLYRVALGVLRLGILANFVSDSVVVGFTAGAGILIIVNQVRHILRLTLPSDPGLINTLQNLALLSPETHLISLGIGLGAMLLLIVMRYVAPRLPAALIAMIAASVLVGVFDLQARGVIVIGELPRSLPPLADLPWLDGQLIIDLMIGAFALGTIGLVEAISISRAIAAEAGQRLDSNQEFIGQGLANVAAGLFSGYPVSGSFARSAVNYNAGAQTQLAAVFSALFVGAALLVFAPWAALVPRAALAGVLVVTAFRMINWAEMGRIWRGSRGDGLIMTATLVTTLILPLEFAVLTGVVTSLVRYVLKTSVPQVQEILPDDEFRHLVPDSPRPSCPQLAVFEVVGDLYFGAVNHVEAILRDNLRRHPDQRFLLLRMRSVSHCDLSGIHMLESLQRMLQERGGDLYLMSVRDPVYIFLNSMGFVDSLGAAHFLHENQSLGYLFQHVLDPAICIYECEVRTFLECQNLPKYRFPLSIPALAKIPMGAVKMVDARELYALLRNQQRAPLLIDVREAREFKRAHIPGAIQIPLGLLLEHAEDLDKNEDIVLVCRGGRRSTRAAYFLMSQDFRRVRVLQGGLLAWESAGLLEAVEF